MTRRRLAIAVLFLLAFAGLALARPGGGESFSSGGGGGGGGGGVGSAIDLIFFLLELIYYLFILFVDFPFIALPITIALVVWIVIQKRRKRLNGDWNSGPASSLGASPSTTSGRPDATLDDIRKIDPDFSRIVFEDFAFRLFSTAQRARADDKALATVGPYVSEEARKELHARGTEAVQQVVIGSMHVENVAAPYAPSENASVSIRVSYEANVEMASATEYSVEAWEFERKSTVHSKPPGKAHTFPCPNCGAPWQAKDMGSQVCASCGQVVDNGRFDWIVSSIDVTSSRPLPPTVTEEVPEQGTDDPTVVADDLAEQLAALTAADANVTEPTLVARLTTIYDNLNKSWANNELAPARPFVSDALYDYLQYWIDTYKRQTLRNPLEKMRITRTQLAKVERDKYYDAVTIRLWGTGLDYVIHTDSGRVVRGSKHVERAYSEYWTLIRSAGKQGKPQTTATCNNCGAPLTINMAGDCEHCGAHVTSGEFDWVLSTIAQDDTYEG
ncbi:MAG TPA: TIM44-like domain-containing protein [Kofleriaceae bacterium]|jgi:predicted lipid-binding transport protein (Tim44 family)